MGIKEPNVAGPPANGEAKRGGEKTGSIKILHPTEIYYASEFLPEAVPQWVVLPRNNKLGVWVK